MRVSHAILVLSLVVAPPVPGQAASADPLGLDPITLPPALDRVLRDYEAAWEAGDGARLAALFTEDGFALNNGSLPMRGRSRIAPMLTQPGGDLQLRAFAYATGDSVGYIVGGFRYPGTTGPGGKFLLALRKGRDGRWLIAADMDNNAASMRRP
jgi:ketosteroid isomerase-like protein